MLRGLRMQILSRWSEICKTVRVASRSVLLLSRNKRRLHHTLLLCILPRILALYFGCHPSLKKYGEHAEGWKGEGGLN